MNIRFGSSESPLLRFSANRRLNNAVVAVVTTDQRSACFWGKPHDMALHFLMGLGLDPARYENAEALG